MSRARPGPYGIGSSEVVDIASDLDGEVIHMAVVRPKVPETKKVPVIVLASPYFDHNFGRGDPTKCEPRLMDNFVEHGYAIGLVAVRGSGDSGGCSDLMGNKERADLDQAITWFGTQPWSNGRVGMIGVSYDGSTPWEVAAEGNKYLKTIVPISGVNDPYHLMFHNGAVEWRGPVLSTLYYTYPLFPGDALGRQPTHHAKSLVCPEAAKGVQASAYSSVTGERDPLGYWAERNSRPGVEKNYKGSIFLARGLQDWNVDPSHDFPWVTELDREGLYVKYMLGQWQHDWPDSFSSDENMSPGEPVRWDWADILLDWWDRWLKNDKTVDLGPRAQVQDSSGDWRNERTWPPPDAKPQRYFLSSDRRLKTTPSATEATYPIVFDAMKPISNNPNRTCACARFSFGPVDRDLRFAGIPKMSATVVPQGPTGHLSAWLYAGKSSPEVVGWGMVDLRFARGGEQAAPVIPGQPLKVTIPIEPLDVVVEKGESLLLVIAESGYGGQGTLPDRVATSPPFPMELQVGGAKSVLTLDTFTRRRGVFFTPPKTPRPPP